MLFYLLVRSRKRQKDRGNCAVGDCKNGYGVRWYGVHTVQTSLRISDILTGVAELIFIDVKSVLEYSVLYSVLYGVCSAE